MCTNTSGACPDLRQKTVGALHDLSNRNNSPTSLYANCLHLLESRASIFSRGLEPASLGHRTGLTARSARVKSPMSFTNSALRRSPAAWKTLSRSQCSQERTHRRRQPQTCPGPTGLARERSVSALLPIASRKNLSRPARTAHHDLETQSLSIALRSADVRQNRGSASSREMLPRRLDHRPDVLHCSGCRMHSAVPHNFREVEKTCL